MNPTVHSKAESDLNASVLANQTGIIQFCLINISTYNIHTYKYFILISFLSRFHIKLFMVGKTGSGHICGFSIYTEKGPNYLPKGHVTLDPDCSRTMKTVVGLLDRVQLLDTGDRFDYVMEISSLINKMFK